MIPVDEIYSNPQIYFYSPIIGFFPGTIYDEDLNISFTLIFYRTLNFIFFGSLYFVAKRNFVKNKSLTLALFIAVALLFIWISPELGFSTNHTKLNRVLSGKIESENFIIHFDKKGIDSTEIKILLLNHEYYFEKLEKKFGFKPNEKIKSYIFNNRLQKKKYFGSEQADIAKPWLYEIYLSNDSWENTLNHELAHIFSAEIGSGIFRLANSFNPTLIEGFAEAMDDNYDDLELHSLTASAYYYGYKIDIKELFSGLNFFKSFSGLSYLYAGSFSKYLIEKYSMSTYAAFYNSGDSKLAFGKTLDELANDYYEFIKNHRIQLSKNQIEYYFGRNSIFQKVCPRQIAANLKEAEKFIIHKKYSNAEEVYKHILNKTSNYSAILGLITIYTKQERYSAAKSLIDYYITDFERTPYFYFLKLFDGDIKYLISDTSLAIADYKFISENNPNIQLKLLADLRMELQQKIKLKNYLESSDSSKFRILINLNEKENIMSSILPMINLAERIRIQPKNLLEAFHSPLIPSNDEDAYCLFQLSKYLLKNGDLVNARKLASLANRKSFGSVYYIAIKEQFEKCNWFIKNFDVVVNQSNNKE